MATFDTIKKSAAERIAANYFDDAVFVPRVGNRIDCKATLVQEADAQPEGLDTVADVKRDVIVYRKEQIADSVMEPGGYFLINSVKYFVEGASENDGPIFGYQIVKNENQY